MSRWISNFLPIIQVYQNKDLNSVTIFCSACLSYWFYVVNTIYIIFKLIENVDKMPHDIIISYYHAS